MPAMNKRLRRRLKHEFKILEDPPPGVCVWPHPEGSLTSLRAQIEGPADTPYSDGVFELEISIPERYPFEPPKLRFLTPIYHPNIDNAGRICHDALKMPPAGAWNPAHNVSNLLTTIRFLIAEPNADDGLMPDITQLYTTDRPTFISIAKQHTLKHATSSVRRASSAGPALSARASNSHTSDVSSGTQQPSSAALASQVEPPAAEDAPLKRSAPINNTDVGGVSKKSREGEVSSVEDVDAEVELPPSSKVSTDDRSNEEQGGDDSDIEIIYVTRRHNQDC